MLSPGWAAHDDDGSGLDGEPVLPGEPVFNGRALSGAGLVFADASFLRGEPGFVGVAVFEAVPLCDGEPLLEGERVLVGARLVCESSLAAIAV